jgi:hypothetical protein
MKNNEDGKWSLRLIAEVPLNPLSLGVLRGAIGANGC